MDKVVLIVVEPSVEIMTPTEVIASFIPLLERAGRTCYKSEDKITDASAEGFIRNIIRSGHESVIEHCSLTVRLIGDRAMSHQLVRHRIAAYSQESQRFCDYGKKGLAVVIPPSVGDIPPGDYAMDARNQQWYLRDNMLPDFIYTQQKSRSIHCWLNGVAVAYRTYLELRSQGILPEDARSVLPNCTKTEVVATFNLRQWRHVFVERALNRHAQWQIKRLMQQVLTELNNRLPCIFGDLYNELLIIQEKAG